MAKTKKALTVQDEVIVSKIYLLRDQKVMVDRDLAELYNVRTGNLNKAVKRNLKRFPKDFMFKLTAKQFKNLIFQNGTSNLSKGKAFWGGTRKMPNVFTEQGVAMLSSVLNSDIAIEVNIRIIRIFAKLWDIWRTNKHILFKIEQLEKKVTAHDEDIQMVFKAMKQLLSPPLKPRPVIGFKRQNEK
jgi:hypothetical protein